jgi:hypothetical protein
MVNIKLLPSLAWGVDKAIKIELSDNALINTETPSVTVLELGADPSNSITMNLAFNPTTALFEGTFYATSDAASVQTPKLVLTKNVIVQVTYTAVNLETDNASLTYYLTEPTNNGKYVEVRSSVRNLHWDIVTILTKAGWKFVESLPPKVNVLGYVTEFTHVLKTITTPVVDEHGVSVNSEMFLLVTHMDYPGDNAGNFKRIQFKLSPNYYYYDKAIEGVTPDTRQNDILHVLNNMYKLAEFPTYPINVDFVADAVSNSIPNVLDIPVNIWGYASRDHFSFIFQGEPSLSLDGFGMVSHVYCGKIDSFKEGQLDVGGNFALTGSSDSAVGGIRYGDQTSDGVATLSMYRTYGGLMWQSHYASIIHDDPSGDARKSELYQPSSWSGKFHLSPIYVYHSTDGKRGFLKEVLVVNKQGILHLDELEIIKPISDCDPCPVDSVTGLPIDPNDTEHAEYNLAWKREKYKYYRLTSTNHFLKSFGVKDNYKGIGIAIKMEVDEAKIIKFNTAYDIVTGRGVSSWTGIGSVPLGAELAGARTESISAGMITLTTGGNPYVEPTVTGDMTMTVIRDSVSNDATAVTMELMINEDPVATSQLTASATSNNGAATPISLGSISFPLYRAGELDVVGKYGFRGTFNLTDTGLTSDVNDILKYASGGNIIGTVQTVTETITM